MYSLRNVFLTFSQFVLIVPYVLIVKSQRIVTSVLPVTGCDVCLYHFSVRGRLKYLRNIECMKLELDHVLGGTQC